MDESAKLKPIGQLLDRWRTEQRIAECETHGEYSSTILILSNGEEKKGSGCPVCRGEAMEQTAIEREKEIKEFRRARELGDLVAAGIPKRFRSRSFADYKAITKEQKRAMDIAERYAKSFEQILERGTSLIFCGNPGTGKTHLACAIANCLIPKGITVSFTTVLKAVRSVKETYSSISEKTEGQVLNAYSKLDLLILDEVGVQFGSETEKMIITEIINNRYEDVKPTILISNLKLDGITEYLGERVVDRMRENGGAVVAFNWESNRG